MPFFAAFAYAHASTGRTLFDAVPDSAFYSQYPFIRFINPEDDASIIQLTDDQFLDEAGRVIFKVNRFDVITNDSVLRLLGTEIIPRINRDSLRLRRLILRGAASPEGPFLNNKMLGTNRAKMLADFLRQRLAVPVEDSTFSSEVVIEDYRLLCAMMRRAGDPDQATVQMLCDLYLPKHKYAHLKSRLQGLQQGRLWRRLLRDYFPELRAARLVLVFENEPVNRPKPEPEKEETLISSRHQQGTSTGKGQTTVQVKPEPEPEPEPVKLHRREVLAVKSNLLFDFAYMPGYDRWCPIPNIALEYFPRHGHFTYGASFDGPWWQHYHEYKFFQIRNYQLEARYYFRSNNTQPSALNPQQYHAPAFRGFYLQAYTHLGLFSICFDENRGWEGEGVGAGIGLGYVLPLSRRGHWRLEFGIQAGFFACKYDPYQYEYIGVPGYEDYPHDDLYYYKYFGDPSLFKERQYRFTWLGPTRIGITLSYDLLYRRIRKKGASFRAWEKD